MTDGLKRKKIRRKKRKDITNDGVRNEKIRRKKRRSSVQRLEGFWIHDIIGDLVNIGFLDQYRNVMDICRPGKRHIQLAMSEHRGPKVDANGKSQADRELEPCQPKIEVSLLVNFVRYISRFSPSKLPPFNRTSRHRVDARTSFRMPISEVQAEPVH